MKLYMVLLVVGLVAAVVSARRGGRKNRGSECKYDKGEWGTCDTATNEQTRTLTLRGTQDGCEDTKTQTRPCKLKKPRCKYTKGQWGECDAATNLRSRTLTLKSGETECDQTTSQTIKCDKYNEIMKGKEERKKAKQMAKTLKKLYKKLRKLGKAGCVINEEATPCNTDTNTVNLSFTLTSGDAAVCALEPVEISCQAYEMRQNKMEKQDKKKGKKDKNGKRKNRKNREG